jgi:hypothetical protein
MAQNIDFGDLAVKPFGEYRRLALVVKKYPVGRGWQAGKTCQACTHRRGRHGARYAMN